MVYCTGCKADLPEERFAFDKARSTTRRYRCRICSAREFQKWKASPGYHVRLAKEKENRRRLKESNPKLRWAKYTKNAAKARAKKNGIFFDLTETQVFGIVADRCPLLGIELSYTNLTSQANSAALDRIDNDLGYVHGNVWVISMLANRIKTNASLGQLETLTRNWRRLVDACII